MREDILIVLLAFALCWQIEITSSRTSTLWRLNSGKITGSVSEKMNKDTANIKVLHSSSAPAHATKAPLDDPITHGYSHDHIFYIITSTHQGSGAGWVRQSPENLHGKTEESRRNNATIKNVMKKEKIAQRLRVEATPNMVVMDRLDCGKPANYTSFDFLLGIEQRHYYHPPIPEPEVAYIFLKSNDEYAYRNFDITALERRLKRAKQIEKDSVQLCNEIGNYFRILGDSRQAIECFRCALAISNDTDVLLNLARVLFNLEYFDDAIILIRKSIDVMPLGYIPWQQYFILGEIFRARGELQESSLHLRRALELYPHHEPILKVLRNVESNFLSALHVYTAVIIIILVVAVCVVIITSSSGGSDVFSSSKNNNTNFGTSQFECESRPQRHFNRAMAMRSLKGLSSSRHCRHRKF